MHRFAHLVASASLLFSVAACGDPSKEDILRKADGAETKRALEDALGQPDDIAKLGPIERWSYQASNGTVIFVITGDRVAIEAAAGN